MRIDFERSGGFAGMRMTTTVDTESLSSEETRELFELVEGAGFFELPAKISSESPGADRFQYKLTIEAEGRQHTVETGEAAVPEKLRALIQKLTMMARKARRS